MKNKIGLIAVGSSAGGIEALKVILSRLDLNCQIPIVIVQHIGKKTSNSLVSFFGSLCPLEVKEVEDKEKVKAGTVYFAPAGYHILIESDYTFSLSVDEPVSFSRPSVDVLFESASDVYREALVAVVLTGANHDGAKGFAKVMKRGGTGIVQKPETTSFPTMPESAIAAAQPTAVLTIDEISNLLTSISKEGSLVREV